MEVSEKHAEWKKPSVSKQGTILLLWMFLEPKVDKTHLCCKNWDTVCLSLAGEEWKLNWMQ